jgi:hypothetical protein
MEIFRQQTSNKLTIGDVSWQTLMYSLFTGLIGAFAIFYASAITTFTCQRQSPNGGSCELRKFGLTGFRQTIPLNTIHGSQVISNFSARSTSYHLFILTEAGAIQFPSFSSGRGEKEAIASQINTFLRTPNQPFFKVSHDERLSGLLFGSLFFTFGSATLLFSTEFLTCSFDKSRGLMSLKQRNFLLKTRVIQQPIRKIQSANIEATHHSFIDRWFRTVNFYKYYIVLVLKSGEHYRLTGYDTRLLKGKQRIVDYMAASFQRDNKLEQNLQHQLSPEAEKLTQQALEEEITTWQEYIRINPDHAEAHYQLGLALYRHHQRQEAAANLQRARDIFTTQGNCHKASEVQNFLSQWGLD